MKRLLFALVVIASMIFGAVLQSQVTARWQAAHPPEPLWLTN